jgi:hypothetical protein
MEEMENKKCIPKLMQEAIDKMETAKKAKQDSIAGLIEMRSEEKDSTAIESDEAKPGFPSDKSNKDKKENSLPDTSSAAILNDEKQFEAKAIVA